MEEQRVRQHHSRIPLDSLAASINNHIARRWRTHEQNWVFRPLWEAAVHFYSDRIYPHLVSTLGDPKPIREIRQRLIPLAQGKVLEIGVGPGANFPHYDPGRVTKVYALEPNPGMIRLAEQQRQLTKLAVEFLDLPGERIPPRGR